MLSESLQYPMRPVAARLADCSVSRRVSESRRSPSVLWPPDIWKEQKRLDKFAQKDPTSPGSRPIVAAAQVVLSSPYICLIPPGTWDVANGFSSARRLLHHFSTIFSEPV